MAQKFSKTQLKVDLSTYSILFDAHDSTVKVALLLFTLGLEGKL